ncbi:RICIN domain-containing protein [Streptomyces beigongshangae]|uniref:RICIN domain-containing protein n=1 Tax=Streptomyces beigongshangae TaxID=2841597 RepID=UPI001C85F7AF|nr:RICIN domain-containing protein [Streptomyces sp. REN17]
MRAHAALPSRTTSRLLTAGLAVLSLTAVSLGAVEAVPRGTDAPSGATALLAPRQTFQNDATKRCLDDHGNVSNLRTFPCNNTDFQKWEVHNTGGDTRVLKNVATGRCLDDHGDVSHLRTFSCNATDFQKWRIARYEGGAIQVKNVATNRCLDDHGNVSNLRTFSCNWQHHQAWR